MFLGCRKKCLGYIFSAGVNGHRPNDIKLHLFKMSGNLARCSHGTINSSIPILISHSVSNDGLFFRMTEPWEITVRRTQKDGNDKTKERKCMLSHSSVKPCNRLQPTSLSVKGIKHGSVDGGLNGKPYSWSMTSNQLALKFHNPCASKDL